MQNKMIPAFLFNRIYSAVFLTSIFWSPFTASHCPGLHREISPNTAKSPGPPVSMVTILLLQGLTLVLLLLEPPPHPLHT